ncbi:MAG: thiamine phosphate synthase [Actinomycetota bacterium]|nr:thiamine phosphate synthase [Actinomycetota bacterium]
MSDPRTRLALAHLYLVCDERPDTFVQGALLGGVDLVQLRIKGGADQRILAVASRYRRLCDAAGALLILNDRPDLAVAAGADGVHVGQDDGSVASARKVVGAQRIIGRSTHSRDQIEQAAADGVDYIGVGPVHATPTKPGRPAVGLDLVRYAAQHSRVPFFAIGGITTANVTAVHEAGARGVAVVRAITEAPDPQAAAGALRSAIVSERSEVGVL